MNINLNHYLCIEYMSYSELLGLFMLDIEEDDYYHTIAMKLLTLYQDNILSFYDDCSIRRKTAIIFGIGLIEHELINNTLKDFLIKKLEIKDYKILSATLFSLSQIDNIDFNILEPFLNHGDSRVKSSAIQFFARKKNILFKNELVNYLKDDDVLIRETALDEIDFLAYEGFLDDIKICLEDKDLNIRMMAEETIQRYTSLKNDLEP